MVYHTISPKYHMICRPLSIKESHRRRFNWPGLDQALVCACLLAETHLGMHMHIYTHITYVHAWPCVQACWSSSTVCCPASTQSPAAMCALCLSSTGHQLHGLPGRKVSGAAMVGPRFWADGDQAWQGVMATVETDGEVCDLAKTGRNVVSAALACH